VRAVATRVVRASGAIAVGITVAIAGSSAPAASSTSNLPTAEAVAATFVNGFESFSYEDPTAKDAVSDLATPALGAILTSPSQAAPGSALASEKFTVTAHVTGFEVDSDTPTRIELLARTDIRVSTIAGSSSSTRLVPVTLVPDSTGWKVSDVDGVSAASTVTPEPSSPPSTSTTVPSVPMTPTTTIAGPGTVVAPPPGVGGGPVGDIPAAYASLMQAAVAAQCPGLPWTVLAGIAKVESDFGKSKLPGVHSGSNSMGAEGPMQFEPATFAHYSVVAPSGADPASPYDPADAIYSAARLLCADGGGNPAHLHSAIFDYNHSDAYVALVLAYANQYAQMASGGSSPGVVARGLGSVIVADAETYLGTKYVWGGESPGLGFDCSGLVQWVYAHAGISLPRVAQDQYNHGPHLPAGATLYPGDLVFFGSGPSAVEHVGIYVGNGQMIDAPYTGAVVRFDRVASVSIGFVGATRPEIPDLTVGAGVPVLSTSHPTGGGSASGTGAHPSGGAGPRPPSGRTGLSGGAGGSAVTHTGRRQGTTTTTMTGPTTTRPGPGRHPTTTTSSTVPSAPTTTVAKPSRHHPTTTTSTTLPQVTTTTTAATPTTTTAPPPPGTTTTSVAATPSSPSATAPTRPGHHHH
jgi:cell wall-associated NlpC family hydrolase